MRDHKPGEWTFQCSRTFGGGGGSDMIIEMREPISGAVLNIEMPLDQFTMAITSAAGHGTLRHHSALDKIGLRQEYRHVRVGVPTFSGAGYEAARAAFREKAIAENHPDGYEFSHASFTQAGLSISYARWVAP